MRSFALIAVGALALVLAGASRPAVTATKTVKITATAFSPASVTIKTTDAIKWSNTDTKAHQVVANNGAFASPTIAAGHTWTHTFNTAGTFKYHDALHPALTGKAATSHAGRKVYIQRFTKFHEWVKFRAVVLGPSSGRVVRLHLKRRGRYVLRVFMSINQAGTGYLEGYSRTIVFRVR